jgi:probable phosphoglycerate mutase
MELILVRHGHPEVPKAGKTGNPPLSERGHGHARCSADVLRLEKIEAIWTSGLRRADATAQPLARILGLNVRTLKGLGEIDRDGGAYSNIEMIREKGREEWKHFLENPIGYFGLDRDAFRAETLEAFSEVMASGHAGKIAIFTHGFPINILLSHALGINHDARFVPHYGSITRLTGHRLSALTVVSVNETGHVPEDLR